MEVVQLLVMSRKQDKAFKLLIEATKPGRTRRTHALLAATYRKRKNPNSPAAAKHAIKKAPKSIVGYKTLMQVFAMKRKAPSAPSKSRSSGSSPPAGRGQCSVSSGTCANDYRLPLYR